MKAFRRHKQEAYAAGVVDCPVPEPNDQQVLLRVHYCGVCGSDLHAFLNHNGYESVLPQVTFGHEFAGTIERIGSDVSHWAVGQKATILAAQACLRDDCRYCAAGDTNLCPKRKVQGLHLDGGMAEYVVIDQRYLVALPDNLEMKAAALTEPLSVADHCVIDCSHIQPGDLVVVTGPGIIGMLCALVARHVGGQVVVVGAASDDAVRLPAARQIGFETVIVGNGHPELAEQIQAKYGCEADGFIEASGAPPALTAAADTVRMNGWVTVVAIYASDVVLNMTSFVRKQIDIRTCYASAMPSYIRAFKLLADGKIPVEQLVRTYPLEDALSAFADAEKQAVMKPMLIC